MHAHLLRLLEFVRPGRPRLRENSDLLWLLALVGLAACSAAIVLSQSRVAFEYYRLGHEIQDLAAEERRLELEIDRLRVERAWRLEGASLEEAARAIGMQPGDTTPIVAVPAGGLR